MRYLVQGALGRRISWMLVTTLLLPLLALAAMPREARAQLTRTPQVAVLDFGNLAGAQAGGILGRQATDAVVVEMSRTGRFDPTPRTQLNQQLQDLGLTPPLDNIGIRKLGQALGVDFVATGDITSVRFTGSPRRAQVTLSVRMTDVASGELANGAIATGYSSPPPPGFQSDDDTLINQAISNAAFNAVATISNYSLPEATILTTRDDKEVVINRGGRDGIQEGLEMIVLRGGDRIGKIRVTRVAATDSTAAIIDRGKGIRPEDRARAIFSIPGYRVDDSGVIDRQPIGDITEYRPARKKSSSALGTILGIAAAILLAGLLFRSKSSTDSSGVTGLSARALADPSDVSQGPSSARVRVNWSNALDIPAQNIVEYHVFRDGQIIGRTFPGDTEFLDPVDAVPFTYRQVQTDDEGLPTELEEIDVEAVPGLTVGVTHRYRVNVVYRRIIISTGTGGGGGGGGTGDGDTQFQETSLTSSTKNATPIARPGVVGPTGSQRLGGTNEGVTIVFSTVQGANSYVFEFADNAAFNNKKVKGPFTFGYTPGQNSQSIRFDLRDDFRDIVNSTNGGEGRIIFFRVGARNQTDDPGPISEGVPNGGPYIYSSGDSFFTVLGGPPPPPGG